MLVVNNFKKFICCFCEIYDAIYFVLYIICAFCTNLVFAFFYLVLDVQIHGLPVLNTSVYHSVTMNTLLRRLPVKPLIGRFRCVMSKPLALILIVLPVALHQTMKFSQKVKSSLLQVSKYLKLFIR